MPTILGTRFTAVASPLPPDGVRTKRSPRILYRSADAPTTTYDYDTGQPVPAPAPKVDDKAIADATSQIGKALADTLGGLFGTKAPAPSTVAEKRARDV